MSLIAWMWRQVSKDIARTVVIEYEQDGQLCLLRCVLAPGKVVRDDAGRILARVIVHTAPDKMYRGKVYREPQTIIDAIADTSCLSKNIGAITLIFCDFKAVEIVSIRSAVIFVH